jgi:hypothetical protein
MRLFNKILMKCTYKENFQMDNKNEIKRGNIKTFVNLLLGCSQC